MPSKSLTQKIKKQLASISNKRARIVIQHILKHGFITTEDLEKKYGYNHPPRAARDVREAGIPLETFRVQSSGGRSIAAYKFGDLKEIRQARLQGRRTFPKQFKEALYEISGGRCAICSGSFESRYLQLDHRIPYEVAGDETGSKLVQAQYMLLCGSCNRAKSWSCEHCPNWVHDKASRVCSTCYWASPENYVHIGLREVRRVDIQWNENEIQAYERLKTLALENNTPVPEYVKTIVSRHSNNS